MTAVLGQLLPLAIGVAISPVPVITTILLLLAPQARDASIGFMVGWLLGIVAVVLVVLAISSAADLARSGTPSTVAAWIRMLLGVLLLVLGVRQWRHRPAPGQVPEQPGWMAAVDTVGAGKALGLGFLLAAVNPKNLTLCISAGVAIGAGNLDAIQAVVAIAAFALLAGCTVLVPVVASAVAGERLVKPLAELREWLTLNSATVMSVLLVVMGAVLAGKGMEAL